MKLPLQIGGFKGGDYRRADNTVVSQTRPPTNFTPVNFDHPPSPNPGSSIANVRNIVGAPPGGFRPGDYDIAGNTPDAGAGFTDTWRPPFADTDAQPDAVRKQEQIVVITRLAHSLSYPKIYDGSLGQLQESLNSNNPGMRFFIDLQQSFWPSGNILLIIGEDPKVASESGRVEGSLKDSFAEKEEMQLKKYVESGGILLVMEATPYYSTGGFRAKMEEEVKKIFREQWKNYPIFFAGGDFIKEFNQSNNYNYLAEILSTVLGKPIN
jgi:hypothetical protein